MGCTVMSNINFDNPWLLLVAVPLIVLFTVPFLIAVRKDNRNAHNIASQIMHVVLAIIIGFAAAGTNFTTVLTKTQVYVVADVSYSANKNLDTIDNIIKSQIELPKNSQVGVITFGKNYELLCDLTDQSKVTSVKTSIENGTVDDSETNIAPALLYAGTLFGEEVIKRVVLITDGKQTDDVDTSAMRRAVDTLEAQGVKVDAYFLDDNLSSDTPEVQISSAEFTPSTFLNHDETVSVSIQSNVQTDVMVYLYKNGEMLDSSTKTAKLDEGNNRVEMNLDTTESGWHNYEVRIRVVPEENDASEFNNSYTFTQNVESDKKVLIVTGEWEDAQLLIDQYAGNSIVDLYENAPQITSNTRKSFQEAVANNYENATAYCFDLDIVASGMNLQNVPYTLEDLCQYDEIVLSNVDIREINFTTMFMQNLESAVATLGKSLITLGNTYIADTLVEPNSDLDKLSAMLPVRYGPSLNGDRQYYTIIMDISSSMLGVQLQAAKDVAKKLINTLQDEEGNADMISLIAFYGNSWEFYGPKSYKGDSETINEIYEMIDSLEVRQGTNLSGALRTAYNNLNGSSDSYTNKQIMLITDGENSTSDYEPSENYVQMLYEIGVITSIFDVGRLGDNAADAQHPTGSPNTSNSAYQFLRRLYDIGVDEGGNHLSQYYYCYMTSAQEVPDILFGDMFEQIKETKIENTDTKVIVNRYADDVLEGMPNTSDDMPHVTGYYVGTARGSAISVLDLDYGKKPDGSPDYKALYAYWTYGEGKVASFASSPSDGWMEDWSNNGKTLTQTFLNNVLDTNIPSVKAAYPYTFSVLRDGNATHITVVPPRDNNSSAVLKLSATIKVWLLNSDDSIDTDGIEPIKEATMTFNKDRFSYSFTSSEEGKYKIEVVYLNSNLQKEYSSVSVFNVAYANEYNSFTGYEASPLFRAINGRGQVVVDNGKLILENEDYEVGTYTNDYTVPLLVIAVVLFVVDIIVRKLKWEDIVSFFGGFKKTQTTGGKKS